jgi:hypothetical protein
MKLKRQQIKLLTQQHKISMAEQFHMAWMKTQTCVSQEPRCHSPQLSYNSTATSGLHCNRMLHTTVQSVFVTPFTIWLQQGNHQRLFYLFKKRKLFSRNTTVYTCILIITKEYKE